MTKEELQTRLGVSYQSIQKQLLRLKQQGTVLPSFWVNEERLKKRRTFWIFILTKNPHVVTDRSTAEPPKAKPTNYQRNLCNEIKKSFQKPELAEDLAGLIFGGVDIVLGGTYDIILRLFTENPDAVALYVTKILRGMPEISATSTAWGMISEPETQAEEKRQERRNR